MLDVAKLLRCRPQDGRFASLLDALRGNAPWPAQVLAPLWLVPTTAGTGGEVTRFATVWDSAQQLAFKRTLQQGLPHGLACSVRLPTAWRLAVGRVASVDAGWARVFDTDARTGGQRLLAWLADVGVDADPRAFGIYDVDRRITVALASERGRHFIGSIEPATT